MKLAWIALAVLLVACAPRGPDPEIVQALADYDEAYLRITWGMKARPVSNERELDFRGLSYGQEYAQRVMTPETRKHLAELRALAANASNLHMATVHLGEARGLLADQSVLANGINAYWTDTSPAPYWRKYWNDLFIANESPIAPPDPLLLTIEKRIRDAIDRNDYRRAADEAKTLPPVLGEAMNRAAWNLVESRRDKARFVARRTPCVPGAPPDPVSGKAKVLPPADLEGFYPQRERGLGIQGTLVLRVKVDRNGCGRQVAIVVRSGVPSLDQAALDWFETAQFRPSWRDGKAVESTVLFPFRFKMDDDESHHSRG